MCEIYFDFLFPEILLLLLTIKKSYTCICIEGGTSEDWSPDPHLKTAALTIYMDMHMYTNAKLNF